MLCADKLRMQGQSMRWVPTRRSVGRCGRAHSSPPILLESTRDTPSGLREFVLRLAHGNSFDDS